MKVKNLQIRKLWFPLYKLYGNIVDLFDSASSDDMKVVNSKITKRITITRDESADDIFTFAEDSDIQSWDELVDAINNKYRLEFDAGNGLIICEYHTQNLDEESDKCVVFTLSTPDDPIQTSFYFRSFYINYSEDYDCGCYIYTSERDIDYIVDYVLDQYKNEYIIDWTNLLINSDIADFDKILNVSDALLEIAYNKMLTGGTVYFKIGATYYKLSPFVLDITNTYSGGSSPDYTFIRKVTYEIGTGTITSYVAYNVYLVNGKTYLWRVEM